MTGTAAHLPYLHTRHLLILTTLMLIAEDCGKNLMVKIHERNNNSRKNKAEKT